MPRYRYALDESAVMTLLALDDAEMAKLVPAFEALAETPNAPPDSYSLDRQGRPLRNRATAGYLIIYWPEHATKTVHIMRIDLLRSPTSQ